MEKNFFIVHCKTKEETNAWSKWVPGSPAYHMPDANGVSDMSDMEKAEAIQKSKAMTPEVYGDGYDPDGNLIYDTWDCPRCGVSYEIDYQYDYCPNCGSENRLE